jgi:hypothetical protein
MACGHPRKGRQSVRSAACPLAGVAMDLTLALALIIPGPFVHTVGNSRMGQRTATIALPFAGRKPRTTLDFIHSCGRTQGGGRAVREGAWDFHHIGCSVGRCNAALTPETLAHQGNTVGKGRARFAILGCRTHWHGVSADQIGRYQGHYRIDGAQGQRGPSRGLITPLALGLDSKVCPSLFTRRFHRPAPDVRGQDLKQST